MLQEQWIEHREQQDLFAVVQQHLPLTVLESALDEQTLGLIDLGILMLSIPLCSLTTCQRYLNSSFTTFSATERIEEHAFTARINFYTVILLPKDLGKCRITRRPFSPPAQYKVVRKKKKMKSCTYNGFNSSGCRFENKTYSDLQFNVHYYVCKVTKFFCSYSHSHKRMHY